MNVTIGPDHAKLLDELYDLPKRLNIGRSEMLVVMMAAHLVEYLAQYAVSVSVREGMKMTKEALEENYRLADEAYGETRFQFTIEDIEDLVGSRSMECCEGRLIPRH